MTRGQRNHNPLNIRTNPHNHWLGEAYWQDDPEFVTFQCDLFGLRAAFRILRSYMRVQHLKCVYDIIHRWAPPEDNNNTRSYIETVCQRTGFLPHQPLSFENEADMTVLVAAMAWVESQTDNIPPHILHQAYRLAR